MKLFSLFVQEIAIDLGTANTLIIQDGNIVIDEPSIIAIDTRTGQTIAVGTRAMQMHEKTHQFIITIWPLKDGVIADFAAADKYYAATREYWDAVLDAWTELWTTRREISVANSDQTGAFAGLFELAEEYAAGRLALSAAKPRIRAALAAQGVQ